MVHVEVRAPAIRQVRALIQGQRPEVGVRLYAQPGGGGCCGGGGGAVAFGLAFAKPRPDDVVVAVDGFSLLVDPTSVPYVDGAVVDYVEDLRESGFKVTNPTLPEPDAAGRAGGCTACGSSPSNGGGCGCSSH